MGLHVALIVDSVSRWLNFVSEETLAIEHRECPYLNARVASIIDRSGVIQSPDGRKGSLTFIGTLSPPAGDLTAPCVSATLRCTQVRRVSSFLLFCALLRILLLLLKGELVVGYFKSVASKVSRIYVAVHLVQTYDSTRTFLRNY